jgi:hypothetical protein
VSRPEDPDKREEPEVPAVLRMIESAALLQISLGHHECRYCGALQVGRHGTIAGEEGSRDGCEPSKDKRVAEATRRVDLGRLDRRRRAVLRRAGHDVEAAEQE